MDLVHRGILGFALILIAVGCGRSNEVVIPENPVDAPPPGSLQHSAAPNSGGETVSTPHALELPPQGQ